MLIHRCHNTTEYSSAVFYFGSDCEFYMIVIWESLTAGRYFSVLDKQKCIILIHNPLLRDAQTSSESTQQSPNRLTQIPNITLLSVMCLTLMRSYYTSRSSTKSLKLRSHPLNLIPDCN